VLEYWLVMSVVWLTGGGVSWTGAPDLVKVMVKTARPGAATNVLTLGRLGPHPGWCIYAGDAAAARR
jgi:hypothetical protein